MKYFIASDIHGSAKYCLLMLQRFAEEKADKLVLLGDILYHGPRNDLPEGYSPKKVIELLNPLKDKIICVRGNCDAEVDQMALDFPIMADYIVIDGQELPIYATHGHHYNPENPFPGIKNYILLNGHTHIPAFKKHQDFYYVNPGSVSIPKQNSRHSYIIYDGCNFIFKDVLTGFTYSSEQI